MKVLVRVLRPGLSSARVAVLALVALIVFVTGRGVRAAEGAGEAVSGAAVVAALAGGAPSRAVVLAESLADRGHVGGALAYHRGLAYARRLGTPEEAPGDAGQAIAAFLEVSSHREAGEELTARVELGLRTVRSHLARKRSSAGETPALEPSPGLVRSTLLAVPTVAWLAAAFAASLVSFALALLAWRAAGETRSSRAAFATLAGVFACAIAVAAHQAHALRRDESLAVVVTARAPLFDSATGALADDETLPEGIALRIRRSDGDTLPLADEPTRALRRDQVRLVPVP